jgi:hypothetical protein
VLTESAPPKVFRPNTGLEPGMSVMEEMAPCGIRSQLTTSPMGSLTRTPSWNTESPWGKPSRGDSVKPRKVISGWNGLPCDSLIPTLPTLLLR